MIITSSFVIFTLIYDINIGAALCLRLGQQADMNLLLLVCNQNKHHMQAGNPLNYSCSVQCYHFQLIHSKVKLKQYHETHGNITGLPHSLAPNAIVMLR